MKKSEIGSKIFLLVTLLLAWRVIGWTGEIHGRVVCDVCGDSSIGPEDHVLEGAEVAVLCITKSGEVLNYQAFTDSKGVYNVAETMPESDRWDSCLARPISSFHEHCNHLGDRTAGVKFTYSHPSGYSHAVRPFVYRPAIVPMYCVIPCEILIKKKDRRAGGRMVLVAAYRPALSSFLEDYWTT